MVFPILGKMSEHSHVVKGVVLSEIGIFRNLRLRVSKDALVPSKNQRAKEVKSKIVCTRVIVSKKRIMLQLPWGQQHIFVGTCVSFCVYFLCVLKLSLFLDHYEIISHGTTLFTQRCCDLYFRHNQKVLVQLTVGCTTAADVLPQLTTRWRCQILTRAQ